MSFEDIPVRENGKQDVDSAWWNIFRTKLIEYAGLKAGSETEWTITDNQTIYANISGLQFDVTEVSYVKIRYSIWRYDGTNERKETGIIELTGKKNDQSWTMKRSSNGPDDALNVSSSIALNVTAGVVDVQFKSDSMGGTYEEKGYFRVVESLSAD